MFKYTVKVRRYFFWRTLVVIGHKFSSESNRMDFYMEDGCILSIGNWNKYDLFLGKDWIIATKRAMENESGQDIKLKF